MKKQGYIDFIEPDFIESDREILHGQTNSQAQGDTQEFAALNVKVSKFDIWLRVKKAMVD